MKNFLYLILLQLPRKTELGRKGNEGDDFSRCFNSLGEEQGIIGEYRLN